MGRLYDYSHAIKGQAGYRTAGPADRARRQIDNAREVIASISDKPLAGERWRGVSVEEYDQLKVKKVKEGARTFGFVFENNDDFRNALYEQLADVIDEFGHKLPVTARWLIQYRTSDRWFTTRIDFWTLPRLQEQIYDETLEWMEATEQDRADLLDQNFIDSDALLHKKIWNIQEIHFLDVTAYEGLKTVNIRHKKEKPTVTDETMDDMLAVLRATGRFSEAQLNEFAQKRYKTREGHFFKYTCSLPIDLEKFQIFRRIDNRTCKIIDEYNCVVWALKEAGLSADIVARVKALIGTRYFPQSKFQEIADEINIGFDIHYYRPNETKTDTRKFRPKKDVADQIIRLNLFDDHYMIDGTVNATTFGITHFEEIKQHPKVIKAGWTDEQILTTTRYVKRKDIYEKSATVQTPVMVILKALLL